jgi:hypothetical protein
LTALGALESRAITVAAIIVSQSIAEPVPTKETAASLAQFARGIPITILPRRAPLEPALLSTLLAGSA